MKKTMAWLLTLAILLTTAAFPVTAAEYVTGFWNGSYVGGNLNQYLLSAEGSPTYNGASYVAALNTDIKGSSSARWMSQGQGAQTAWLEYTFLYPITVEALNIYFGSDSRTAASFTVYASAEANAAIGSAYGSEAVLTATAGEDGWDGKALYQKSGITTVTGVRKLRFEMNHTESDYLQVQDIDLFGTTVGAAEKPAAETYVTSPVPSFGNYSSVAANLALPYEGYVGGNLNKYASTATCSSSYSNYSPLGALDNTIYGENSATKRWVSGSGLSSAWVEYTFIQPITLEYINLYAYQKGRRADSYKFYAAATATETIGTATATPVLTATVGTDYEADKAGFGIDVADAFSAFENGIQKLRIEMTFDGRTDRFQISDLDLFGQLTAVSAADPTPDPDPEDPDKPQAEEYYTTAPSFGEWSKQDLPLPSGQYVGGNLNKYVTEGTASTTYSGTSAMGALDNAWWYGTSGGGGAARWVSDTNSATYEWVEYTFSESVTLEWINILFRFSRYPVTIKFYAAEEATDTIDTTQTPALTITPANDFRSETVGCGLDVTENFKSYTNGIKKLRLVMEGASSEGRYQLCDLDLFGQLTAVYAPTEPEPETKYAYTVHHINHLGEEFNTTTGEAVEDTVLTADELMLKNPSLYTLDTTKENTASLTIGTNSEANVATLYYITSYESVPTHVEATGTYADNNSLYLPYLTDGDTTDYWKSWRWGVDTENENVLTFALDHASTLTSMDIHWAGNQDGTVADGVGPAQKYDVAVSKSTSGDSDWVTVYSFDGDVTSNKTTIDASTVNGQAVVEDTFVGVRRVRIAIHRYAERRVAICEVDFFALEDGTIDVTVNYFDEDGQPIIDSVTAHCYAGEYSPEVPYFEGYHLPAQQTITVSATDLDKNVVTYTYKKTATIKSGVEYHGKDGTTNFGCTFDGKLDGNVYTAEWANVNSVRGYTWTFDKQYDITATQLIWATAWNDSTTDGTPDAYLLQVSSDGKAYKTVLSLSSENDNAFGVDLTAKALNTAYNGVANRRCDMIDGAGMDLIIPNVQSVRVITTSTNDNSYQAISEVFFCGTPSASPIDTTPIAANVAAPTVQAGGEGETSTYTFTFTLPKLTNLTALNILNAANVASRYDSYTVETSTDGTNWASCDLTVMYAQPVETYKASDKYTDSDISVVGATYQGAVVLGGLNVTNAKYIRLTVTGVTEGVTPAVDEVYVFGTKQDGNFMVGDTPMTFETEGANIRLGDEATGKLYGIRFGFDLTREFAEATEGYRFGALLFPEDRVQQAGFETLHDFVQNYLGETLLATFIDGYGNLNATEKADTFLPIEAKKLLKDKDEKSPIRSYTAVLTNIAEAKDMDRKIVAIPYFIDEATGTVYYGQEWVKSYYEVCDDMRKDGYAGLTAEQKTAVEQIINDVEAYRETLNNQA